MIESKLIELAKATSEEICGFILPENEIVLVDNVAKDPKQDFEIHPDDLVKYLDKAEAIFHSHPDSAPVLTAYDYRSMRAAAKPFWVVGADVVNKFEPKPKLLMREFRFGYADCGELFKDIYHYCGINFKTKVPRAGMRLDTWDKKVMAWLKSEGFTRINYVEDMVEGDLVLTSYSGVANHTSVYIGDNMVAHHQSDRLSLYAPVGESFIKSIHSVWRHKDMSLENFQTIKEEFNSYGED